MVILDYNGLAISSILAMKIDSADKDLIRHVVLNSIRMYNKKFRDEYGKVVIACDGGSWRKQVFPNYKAKRKSNRDKSSFDWGKVFETLNEIRDDLTSHFPYKVVWMADAEADDIIATLVEATQPFSSVYDMPTGIKSNEPVMIVSADKDFIQLQKYNNVRQYSPMTKKFIQEKNPRKYVLEHLFKGDSGDGVPNVLSPDNTFVDSIRQKAITKKKIEFWTENADNLESVMEAETYRNYLRNKKLIDLDEIPVTFARSIVKTYIEAPGGQKSRILNYLISRRCRNLIDCVMDFY